MELKAFSVRQPWSGLLMVGIKRFEVRTWQPPAPDYFLVHAASKVPGLRDERDLPCYQQPWPKPA